MYTVSEAFLDELKQPVQAFRVKMEVLDTDGDPVDGGTFHDVTYTADATGILIDGNVDVNVTQAARRTFTATLLNKFGEWSPNADWSGYFYVDRLIKLYRGVVYRDFSEEIVPIGVFFIDHADVIVERNMSVVTLSGTDKWKKIAKSEWTAPESFASGLFVNTMITNIANDAGITSLSLDPLTSRTTDEKELNKRMFYERGDKRSDALIEIGKDYGLDIYFDANGVLVSQDMVNPMDQEVVFRYLA